MLETDRQNEGFLAEYAPRPGVYDEVFTDGGGVRDHWTRFTSALEAMGPQELDRRWEMAQRIIHENGVTYNVYGDPRGMDRPWKLDAVPLLLSAAEWRKLEAGLRQRAMLLDQLLLDLYGPQNLLREGIFPPELVFGHRGFLRPCHGIRLQRGRFLHLYAADIARSADGSWWVLGDRTQAPSGAGYALENRIVLSRSLPDLFRDCKVERLASFFLAMREMLLNLAPRNRENPRIVVLTPGPYNETYFEHSYLARYLGYPLVEGGDLTIRDNCVYLKTLGGLRQVDVILRRLDDDFCDPLELREDSSLGVAGLVQAAHAGTVAIANALGSGLLETPAIMDFLPTISKRLLGEDLLLPSVPTYWCGNPQSMKYVLEHLPELVIKPAALYMRRDPIFCADLSVRDREALIARIRAHPEEYVAQKQLSLSTTPVWAGNRFQPRHLVLRAHGVATSDSYEIMPGGLTRVTASVDTLIVSMQRGGGSKDTWVLGTGPSSRLSLLPTGAEAVMLRRSGNDLPSRLADNLYWLGRYMERAESMARLMRAAVTRLTDESGAEGKVEMPALVQSVAMFVGPLYLNAPGVSPTLEEQLTACLVDKSRPFGAQQTLQALRRIAWIVRDRLSNDTWRILNMVEERATPAVPGEEIQLSEALEILNQIILLAAAFSGLGMENTTRGPGWRFLDMGRRLERALNLISVLRTMLVDCPPERESAILQALLEIADSSMTYRSRYLGTIHVAPALDLLLTDETNPRSVTFQVEALNEHVDALPGDLHSPRRTKEQRLALSMLTTLRLTDVQLLADKKKSASTRHALRRLLVRLSTDLPALSESLSRSYFSHAEASRQLSPNVRVDRA